MTHSKPYKLLESDDSTKTLGEARKRHYPTLIEAANAFVHSDAEFRQIIFDDGCEVRWLNAREQRLVRHVADMLGYDVEDAA
jgi:hypothetical protein